MVSLAYQEKPDVGTHIPASDLMKHPPPGRCCIPPAHCDFSANFINNSAPTAFLPERQGWRLIHQQHTIYTCKDVPRSSDKSQTGSRRKRGASPSTLIGSLQTHKRRGNHEGRRASGLEPVSLMKKGKEKKGFESAMAAKREAIWQRLRVLDGPHNSPTTGTVKS